MKKTNTFQENVLHYSCRVGATISTLSLLNAGAEIEQQSKIKNTPFAEALSYGHEDLCIFLIQNNSNIKIDVHYYVDNKKHPSFELLKCKEDKIISKEAYEEINRSNKNEDEISFQNAFELGTQETLSFSPFYGAIENNMHGIIYLMLSKGFDQFRALEESLIQSKYNVFLMINEQITKNS